MTADELFKELGYIKRENKKTGYVEYNQENKKTGETCTISFEPQAKTIMCSLYIKGFIMSRSLAFNIDELKAINKKVEELGW